MEIADHNHYDFFISYTGDDRAWTKWISYELGQLGYTTVFQAGDWGAGANFVAEISRRLEQADRLIVVASAAYFRSRWPQEEWTSVLYRGTNEVIPLRIEDCKLPGLLAPRVRADLFGVDESEARSRLAEAVKGPSGRAESAPFPGPVSGTPAFPAMAWSNSPAPARDPEFLGRYEEVVAIREGLELARQVVIQGMPGVGKTSLAAELFYQEAPSASFAWWVRSSSPEVRVQDLAHAAIALNLGSRKEADETELGLKALRWLSENDDWLIVLDGASPTDDIDELLSLTRGRLIVTTTDLSWSLPGRRLELQPLSRHEAIQILTGRDMHGPIDELAAVLGDLPLALVQARSFIAATGIEVPDYLALLSKSSRELLLRGVNDGRSSLTASIDVALSHLGPQSRMAMRLIAVMGGDLTPVELLVAPSIFDDTTTLLANEFDVEDALLELRSFGLVNRVGPSAYMHQLIAAIVIEGLSLQELNDAIGFAAVSLAEATPTWADRPENWDRYSELLPHALTVSDHLEVAGFSGQASWLLNRMGAYLEALGEAHRAVDILERAVDLGRESGDGVTWGSALQNLGNAVAATGDLNRAVQLMEHSLVVKRTSGASPFLVARSLGALGSMLRRVGRVSEALGLHQEALEILEDSDEAGAAEVADERRDVAYCLADLGRFDESIASQLLALSEVERALGPESFAAGVAHGGLGTTYERIGDPEQAIEHHARALEIYGTHLEAEHPSMASVLSNYGLALLAAGRTSEGREILERAVEVAQLSLGEAHYQYGFYLGNLADCLAQLGDQDSALDKHLISLGVLESALGVDHRSTCLQRANVGQALLGLGRREEAAVVLREGWSSLCKMPIEPLHGYVMQALVECYIEVDAESSMIDETVESLLEFALTQVPSVRDYALAWVSGIFAALGRIDEFERSLAAQSGPPLVLSGPLEYQYTSGAEGVSQAGDSMSDWADGRFGDLG